MKTTTLLLSAALAALATPAIAGPAQPSSVDVEFADLDLGTHEGQELLERRIDKAARQICQLDRMQTGSRINSAERRCYNRARARVRVQVAQIIEDQQRGG